MWFVALGTLGVEPRRLFALVLPSRVAGGWCSVKEVLVDADEVDGVEVEELVDEEAEDLEDDDDLDDDLDEYTFDDYGDEVIISDPEGEELCSLQDEDADAFHEKLSEFLKKYAEDHE